MPNAAKNIGATIIPCLRYRDAPKAIEWLCAVFGFEKHLVVAGAGDTIAHAQLSFGDSMIMLASVAKVESEFGRLIKHPDEIDGMETQCPYLFVSDADLIYQRAKAAGAKFVIEIKDEEHGGRGFTCRDLEGHLWSVGTYNPW